MWVDAFKPHQKLHTRITLPQNELESTIVAQRNPSQVAEGMIVK
jgi:hypothetical protein